MNNLLIFLHGSVLSLERGEIPYVGTIIYPTALGGRTPVQVTKVVANPRGYAEVDVESERLVGESAQERT